MADGLRRVKRLEVDTELETQVAIVMTLRALGYMVVHVPNGAHLAGGDVVRSIQAKKLIRMGMVKGFPDLVVIGRDRGAGRGQVGFMEVKSRVGKMSGDQVTVSDELVRRGVKWALVRSVDDALRVVEEWGWGPVVEKSYAR